MSRRTLVRGSGCKIGGESDEIRWKKETVALGTEFEEQAGGFHRGKEGRI